MNFSPALTKGCFLPLQKRGESAQNRRARRRRDTYGRVALPALARCSARMAFLIWVLA